VDILEGLARHQQPARCDDAGVTDEGEADVLGKLPMADHRDEVGAGLTFGLVHRDRQGGFGHALT
jgi:hypothetical protein